MKRIIIVGSGAHGRIVAETITLVGGFEVMGFCDDDPAKHGRTIDQWKVLGAWRDTHADGYVVAVGDNAARQRIFEDLLVEWLEVITVLHPRAFVSPAAQVGAGTVVLAGAVISAGAQVGRNVIINIGGLVDHDAVVGDHSHIAPNATVASLGRVAAGEILPPGAVRLRPPAS